MEKAENSDGFDSCDDDGESQQIVNDNNPFKRFKNDLEEIKDENLKRKFIYFILYFFSYSDDRQKNDCRLH